MCCAAVVCLDCVLEHHTVPLNAIHTAIGEYLKMAPWREGGAGKGASLTADVAMARDEQDSDEQEDSEDEEECSRGGEQQSDDDDGNSEEQDVNDGKHQDDDDSEQQLDGDDEDDVESD